MQIIRYIITALLCFPALTMAAQDGQEDFETQQRVAEIKERMGEFSDELNLLASASNLNIRITDANLESGTYTRIFKDKVNMMSQKLQNIQFRWDAFTQSEQIEIAESETLMEEMARIQLLKQAVTDTIDSQRNRCQAIEDFIAAYHFILAQDSIYGKLYKKAQALSLMQKLAPQLEKTKAEEQTVFSKIQEHFDKSKAAAKIIPEFQQRSLDLDEQYYKLKALSEKIQAMEYKPLIQRIKDYLIGLACVSVIIILLNNVVTKLKGAKKARELMKQQKEMINKVSGNDYPTI